MAWYSKFYDETGLIEVGGVQLPARSWFGDTPDAELKQYADSVERLEASGELDNLFKGPCADPVEHIALGNVPDEDEIKFMSHEKSSLERKGKTILFEINPDHGGIVYLGENSLSMDDYTAIRSKKRARSAPAIEAAKQFLIDQMPEGRRAAKELYNLAGGNKISESALKRAKEELGIVTKKTKEFPPKSIWILPGHEEAEPVQEELPL